jgi:WD40 repeat protein
LTGQALPSRLRIRTCYAPARNAIPVSFALLATSIAAAAGALQPPRPLAGHTADVEQICFDPTGSRLLSSGKDGGRIWEVSTGRLLGSIAAIEAKAVFSADGSVIVGPSPDGGLSVADGRTGALLRRIGAARYREIAVAPDGRAAAASAWSRSCAKRRPNALENGVSP